MDPRTEELKAAHDVLAAYYVEHLADHLQRTPVERAVLDLFCEVTRAADLGTEVGDIGSGTGRLTPYLAARGLAPRGVDLSPEMVRVARRDHPGFPFELGDLRALPLADASLAGAVCWYSLIFLAPPDRPTAFRELARVVKPGGHVVIASQVGDGTHQRRGRRTGLGIEFDAYWMSPDEMRRHLTDAGFTVVFWAGRPAEESETAAASYLLAQRT